LVLAVTSKVPEELNKGMVEGDLDFIKLEEAVKRTGIVEKLKKAGNKARNKSTSPYTQTFGYYALSPKWEQKDSNSKHPVVFFLNPMDQSNNNHGWFTVEDLELWIKGKGPIPKEGAVAARKAVKF
jgi:hypothetical protein